jgi:hypothetical protein
MGKLEEAEKEGGKGRDAFSRRVKWFCTEAATATFSKMHSFLEPQAAGQWQANEQLGPHERLTLLVQGHLCLHLHLYLRLHLHFNLDICPDTSSHHAMRFAPLHDPPTRALQMTDLLRALLQQ